MSAFFVMLSWVIGYGQFFSDFVKYIYRLPFVRFCTDSTNKKTRTFIKKKERPCIFVCRFSVEFIFFLRVTDISS